jgi:hypothetical protein
MKEPYAEGLATHSDPESCGHAREDMSEALTGARTGWLSSRERYKVPGAEGVGLHRRQNQPSRQGEGRRTRRGRRPHACTETPCARTGRSRDCPRADGEWGRGEKSKDVMRR